MAIPNVNLLPRLPPELQRLAELALDLRWSWNHTVDRMWEYIDGDLWQATGNPWLILQSVPASRISQLVSDTNFRQQLNAYLTDYHQSMEGSTWFQDAYPGPSFKVAYFSMEYGLSEALPIYSGGLGILAGDYLKTASDLGVPAVGIGLLYQQGYFRQVLDMHGNQTEFFPYNEPAYLPIMPVRDRNGEWVRITINFPGGPLHLRAWEAKVGRVKLYLLDSNDAMNSAPERGITSELYGGGPELRLQQEIVLGIAGWRLLSVLGIEPEVCHLNEGHAALAVLERARTFMVNYNKSFEVALAATRAGNIFTTHTPVEAGFDRFAPELVEHYLGKYADELGIGFRGLMALGQAHPGDSQEPLNMAYLAVRGAAAVNAVSRLHRQVSKRIFQPLFDRWPQPEVPVTYVTNGVHISSWDSGAADTLWGSACGQDRWLGTMETIEEDFKRVSDEALWQLRQTQSHQLISYVRERRAQQLARAGASDEMIKQCARICDFDNLTIGFARRFTEYKRPNLLLHDPERLARIMNHPEQPVQFIIAGKAHPRDERGKELLRQWWQFSLRPDVQNKVAIVADYDMAFASKLVQGVDLWVNTPRRPWEACGTSGMKVLVGGSLNLSEKDGWWEEAYKPSVGWAIGDAAEHDEDPDWDAHEADELYHILENEIVPLFYQRDHRGIPVGWVSRMRTSMAELTPRYSANRMMREYVDRLYVGAAREYGNRIASGMQQALRIVDWRWRLDNSWNKLHFGRLETREETGEHVFTLAVYLGDVEPNCVQVQLYAEPLDGSKPETYPLERARALPDGSFLYQGRVPSTRPTGDYTPRIIPFMEGAGVPLEATHIRWFER
jgi:starch phosphorylase